MSIMIGIGIGCFICYWLRANAEAKQKLVIEQAKNELMIAAMAKHHPSVLDAIRTAPNNNGDTQ